MARRFGGVREVSPGIWECNWRENGVRKYSRVHGTRADAEDRLALARLGLQPTAAISFSEYWRATVEPSLAGLKPKTVYEYRRLWRVELEPLCGFAVVSQTSARDVQRWISSVQPATTQQHAHALMRKVCRMALRDGLLMRDPTVGIEVARSKRRKRTLLDPRDADAWCQMVDGFPHATRMLAMLGCGLSPSEAWALAPDDVRRIDADFVAVRVLRTMVDVGGAAVTNDTPKTEYRERVVVMGPPFSRHVGPMRKVSSPSSAAISWRRWQQAAGWEPATCPSDLRSTFATWAASAGVSDAILAHAMGHSGRTTAAKWYQRFTMDAARGVAERLETYLSDASGWCSGGDFDAFAQFDALSCDDL